MNALRPNSNTRSNFMPEIRLAALSDVLAINNIYNHYVVTSTTTFDVEPWTTQRREQWLVNRRDTHPVFVACDQGGVRGWASLSPYHVRPAFDYTAELSIYIHHERLGQGFGHALMTTLLEAAESSTLHTLVGTICSEQSESVRLHEAHGFLLAGHLKRVGFKFDRWLDVLYYQRFVG